jgi:hypothetical protein
VTRLRKNAKCIVVLALVLLPALLPVNTNLDPDDFSSTQQTGVDVTIHVRPLKAAVRSSRHEGSKALEQAPRSEASAARNSFAPPQVSRATFVAEISSDQVPSSAITPPLRS